MADSLNGIGVLELALRAVLLSIEGMKLGEDKEIMVITA